jgi:hypothetical protein
MSVHFMRPGAGVLLAEGGVDADTLARLLRAEIRDLTANGREGYGHFQAPATRPR